MKIVEKIIDALALYCVPPEKRKKFSFYFRNGVYHCIQFVVFAKILFDFYKLDDIFVELPLSLIDTITCGSALLSMRCLHDLTEERVDLAILVHHFIVLLIVCIGADGFYFQTFQNDRVLAVWTYLFGFLWTFSAPNYFTIALYYAMPENSNAVRDIIYHSYCYRVILLFAQYAFLTWFIFRSFHIMNEMSRGFALIIYFGCLIPNIQSPLNLKGLYEKIDKNIAAMKAKGLTKTPETR